MFCRRASAFYCVKQIPNLSNKDLVQICRIFSCSSTFCSQDYTDNTSRFPKIDKWNLKHLDTDYIPVTEARGKYGGPKYTHKQLQLYELPSTSSNFHSSCSSHLKLEQTIHKASYSTLSNVKRTLLPVFDLNKECQRRMKSTAQLILESSPSNIQPYLRLIRFDKPIGEILYSFSYSSFSFCSSSSSTHSWTYVSYDFT